MPQDVFYWDRTNDSRTTIKLEGKQQSAKLAANDLEVEHGLLCLFERPVEGRYVPAKDKVRSENDWNWRM